MELQGLFGSVVHDAPAEDAKLEGLFGSVVHNAPAEDARLEGLFASVVHNVSADDARLEGLWGTVVHDDVVAPPPGTGTGTGTIQNVIALRVNIDTALPIVTGPSDPGLGLAMTRAAVVFDGTVYGTNVDVGSYVAACKNTFAGQIAAWGPGAAGPGAWDSLGNVNHFGVLTYNSASFAVGDRLTFLSTTGNNRGVATVYLKPPSPTVPLT